MLKLAGKGDTVYALQSRNFPHDFAGVEIKHDQFSPMGNIQAPVFAIGRDVVPAGVTRNGNALDDVIAGRCPQRSGADEKQCSNPHHAIEPRSCFHHDPLFAIRFLGDSTTELFVGAI